MTTCGTMFDFEETRPITETSNELTFNIDISNSQDLIKLLYCCDSQIFEGWDAYKGCCTFSNEVIFKLQSISEEVVNIVKEHKKDQSFGSIVFSGCGTSGRIGFLISKSVNALLVKIDCKPCCEYIIAGGDAALLTSQESPEDSPKAGVKALQEVCKNKKKVLFIGITCGLSAPFVAGQLDYCMEHSHVFVPVLLGFNPTCLARNQPMENWNQTFLTVVTKLLVVESAGRGYIINPIIGPEAITGSSRLKGGTATKLLLEVIMLNALRQLSSSLSLGEPPPANQSSPVEGAARCMHLMNMYRTVWEETYPQALQEGLSDVVDWAGASLNAGGHVYYIGTDELSFMGLLDASECPPTFGADPNDVRCFVLGGLKALGTRDGDSSKGAHFKISLDDFRKVNVPALTQADTVIFLTSGRKVDQSIKILVHSVTARCTQVAVFVCYRDDVEKQTGVLQQCFPRVIEIQTHVKQYIRAFMEGNESASWFDMVGVQTIRQFCAEMSCKLLLNAVSTAAHIRRGKVFHNLMVDLKLSNSKLFQRGIAIVQNLAVCSADAALTAVLRSLYGVDVISEELKQMAVSEHTRIGSFKPKVIPTAVILACKNCCVHEAMEVLMKFPVIRTALAQL
ncbi:glucokinase regulatory protein-like [Asterias rubens]|uniref:glucokinase regulatory protein-like n=1 Tax=Asterias rubens TaxID=7604 RepID=UPI001455B490|nr:glucokinase regulatory protein-like [Asterias rubens]